MLTILYLYLVVTIVSYLVGITLYIYQNSYIEQDDLKFLSVISLIPFINLLHIVCNIDNIWNMILDTQVYILNKMMRKS